MVQFFFPALVLTTLASALGTSWLDQANLRSQEVMATTAEGDWLKNYFETSDDFTAGVNGANELSHRIEATLHWSNQFCQSGCTANIEAIKGSYNDQDTKNTIDIHRQRCM